jgi:hypothetical protein
MTPMPSPQPTDEPPPIRTGHHRRVALIVGAAALAVVAAIIIWSVSIGGPAPQEQTQPEEVIELIPGPLAKEAPSGRRFDPQAESGMPALSEGGRIQNTDEQGKLSQEYRFRRLDPNPPGMPANWVHMDQPQAEFYLKNNRVLSITGASALAHLPARILESGTITGDVTIRLFEPPPGQVLDLQRDEPLLEVSTDKATFDNVMGEVRCPGDFQVETPSLEFPGRGFTMLINDQGERVQLTVEVEHVEFVRLAPRGPEGRKNNAGTDARGPEGRKNNAGPAARRAAETEAGTDARDARGPRAGRRDRPPRPASSPADVDQAQFYRVTLHDQVQIRQGPATGRRTATGDTLTIIFSSKSKGLTPTFANGADRGRHASPAGRVSLACLALVGPGIAPAPSDGDIVVTCAGGLTMVPVSDPAEMLDSPDDARLTLTGQPVRLHDAAQDARAECDRLVYSSLEEKVELLGSASQPLSIAAPRLAAGGDAFWIRRTKGGFTGPGWLEAFEQPGAQPQGESPPATPQLNVRWTDGVDLAFDEPTDDGAMGDLRRAVFRGEVTTADADRTLWADTLEAKLTGAGAGAEIQQVTAEGNIQILLANGARVFADGLVGDPAAETVQLTGADLAIAHEQWLIDKGRRLTLDQESQTADWEGPGTARRFAAPLGMSGERRIARPVIAAEPDARLDWQGSMHYDQAAGDGAGAIDLHGGVTAFSQPNPLERSTFEAQDVSLALAADDGAAGADGSRRLGRIIARGDAEIERRNWTSEDRSGEPRIFFLAGQQIEYDDRTGEGMIPGAGELLIRDLRDSDGDADPSPSALGARGTTAFRWQQELRLTRRQGTLYDIVMRNGIEMRHLSPDQQSATLTCERLEATIDRAGTEPDQAPPAGDVIGGPAELIRLRAERGVFLHTPQRDVDCDVFDYDVQRGVAELSARPGGFVTVMTVGAPQPIRVQRATWDLKRDELTVHRGTGGGTR